MEKRNSFFWTIAREKLWKIRKTCRTVWILKFFFKLLFHWCVRLCVCACVNLFVCRMNVYQSVDIFKFRILFWFSPFVFVFVHCFSFSFLLFSYIPVNDTKTLCFFFSSVSFSHSIKLLCVHCVKLMRC